MQAQEAARDSPSHSWEELCLEVQPPIPVLVRSKCSFGPLGLGGGARLVKEQMGVPWKGKISGLAFEELGFHLSGPSFPDRIQWIILSAISKVSWGT